MPLEAVMSQDISVAYFGLDWNHAYMTLDGLALKLDQLFLQQKKSWAFPAQHLIKALARLDTDLDAHCEAVIKGRTSRKQREYIRYKTFKNFFNAY